MSLAQRIFGAGGSDEMTPSDVAVDLPLEVVYNLLSTWRRRELLRQIYKLDQGDGAKVADLTRLVAAAELGKPTDGLSHKERRRVKVSIYQTHLPKLDDAGLVNHDKDDMRVYATEQTAHIIRFHEIDRSMIAEGRADE